MECMIHPDDPQTIYGSWQYGNLVMSTDGGINYNIILRASSQGEQGEWTSPFVMHPTNPNIIYAGFGNVYKSSDGGWNWSKISNFNSIPSYGYPNLITSLIVPSADTNFIYLTKRVYHSYDEPGAMWKSENSGSSWTDITAGLPDSLYFTYITVDDSDENVVWVTCSGFQDTMKVYKTLDGGSTWTNISNNLPNLPVNCIVHHKLSKFNTVYIGTDIGVYFTNDSLQNIWQFFSEVAPPLLHAAT